jgi:AraC-like DNA-binding protein/mannose-6-phosphate isomerase-like protein (cupin superfamily)
MKLMHEKIDFPGLSPVKVKVREMPYFTYPWHFHDEYEILLVLEGFGTRFIADNIEQFQSGDLVLIGSNVPHFWRSDDIYMSSNGKLNVKYIVIQFPGDFLKEEIKNYPEYHLIGELLSRSTRGIKFDSVVGEKFARKIKSIARKNGLERILLLQDLLQFMAKTTDYKLLAGELYKAEMHDFTTDRLTKVMLYLNTNYQNKIELDQVAEIANLHPSAFCRYFKGKTGKSLSEYVNDMRIGYACRLIIEGKMSISQIGFESGFNNISNFNRTFKKNTGFTPSDYYHQFHNN